MKKLLVVSAVAALGLSSVAFAGGLGEVETMSATPVAAASDTGLYVGLQGGWGFTNWKNRQDTETRKTTNDNGILGRAFVGFDVTRYLAIETGFTYFGNQAKYKRSDIEISKVKTYAFDLMGKVKAPVVDNFDLYAKVGVNYLMSRVTFNKDTGYDEKDYKSRNNFNVAFGAGADYYITPNVIANIEWLRFNGSAKMDKDYQPNTDAFMIGLRYKFDL